MNEALGFIATYLRKFSRRVLKRPDKFETNSDNCDYFHQVASDLIYDGLNGNQPFLVSRFGYSELRALLTYIHIHEKQSDFQKLRQYISGEKIEPWWTSDTIKIITYNAGLFPVRIDVIEDFCELVLEDMKQIDVLGSWLGGERWIKHLLSNAKFMRFHDFYHFLHKRPWTEALKGKRVLVIHPFSKSIEKQYKIKNKIFSGVHQLPDFDLITYKSVQSIAGNSPEGFQNWFEALDFMKSEITKMDFDVAILGCGAYGMPLAAFIKRDLQKKAIHLGGNTQILFGIKGSRWESSDNFNWIFNSHWSRPLPEETPKGHHTIDSNCYW